MLASEINWKRQKRLDDDIHLLLYFLLIEFNSAPAELAMSLFRNTSHLRPLFANDGVVFLVADLSDL